MMRIANAGEKRALQKIIDWMNESRPIRPTLAWERFSSPRTKDMDQSRKPVTLTRYNFSPEEAAALDSLKTKLKAHLEKKARGRCSYCKRPKGRHGLTWHIDHIKGKSRNSHLTFALNNLVYCCADCNYTKNTNVDQKTKIPFDIIDPGAPKFEYSRHLNYLQISTDRLHLLRYRALSPEGTATYDRLKFELLEWWDALGSVSDSAGEFSDKLSVAISQYLEDEKTNEIALLLFNLKEKMYKRR